MNITIAMTLSAALGLLLAQPQLQTALYESALTPPVEMVETIEANGLPSASSRPAVVESTVASSAELAPAPSPAPAPEPAPEPVVPPLSQKHIGIQVGHWKVNEYPWELRSLSRNTGSSSGNVKEWEVNLTVAGTVADMLRKQGHIVDILPATVPVGYKADAFISIHADGALREGASGFKIASSYWDASGKANSLSEALVRSYSKETGMRNDQGNITGNMRGYYAFNHERFQHAISPKTPGVIVELGFITNAGDRKLLVDRPDIAAAGITNGIMNFFQATG